MPTELVVPTVLIELVAPRVPTSVQLPAAPLAFLEATSFVPIWSQ